jgi:hypothetical protein
MCKLQYAHADQLGACSTTFKSLVSMSLVGWWCDSMHCAKFERMEHMCWPQGLGMPQAVCWSEDGAAELHTAGSKDCLLFANIMIFNTACMYQLLLSTDLTLDVRWLQ